MRTLFTALALAIVLAAPGASRAEDMSGDKIRALIGDGITFKLGGPGEGYEGNIKLEPDGTGKGSAVLNNGKRLDVTGTWELEGDQFCRKWAFDDYKRTCETWKMVGPNRIEVFVGGKRIGVNSW